MGDSYPKFCLCAFLGPYRLKPLKVEASKLEDHYPGTLKVKYKGVLALIIVNPCSNFLGFAVNPKTLNHLKPLTITPKPDKPKP